MSFRASAHTGVGSRPFFMCPRRVTFSPWRKRVVPRPGAGHFWPQPQKCPKGLLETKGFKTSCALCFELISGLYRTVAGISFCRAVKRIVSASAPLPLTSATVEAGASTFQDKRVFQWRPPAATYLCREAAKARFDNRTNHRVGFPKGRGRDPSLLVVQGWGIFKGEGRSKLPSPLNGVFGYFCRYWQK